MTVSEIHINLGILLQKVNTHKSKNFLPQELDMLFNFMVASYKNKKTDLVSNPKQVSIFDTHTTLDNLSELFETETVYPISINQGEAMVLLPFNFYGWINAVTNISYDCSTAYNIIPNNTIYQESFLYKLKDINITNLETFSIKLTYQVNGINTNVALFDYSELPTDYMPQDGIKDYKRSFIFINALLSIINRKLILLNEIADKKLYVKYDNRLEALVLSSYAPFIADLSTNVAGYTFVDKVKTFDKNVIVQGLKSPLTISDTEYEHQIDKSTLSQSRDSELRGVRTREYIKVKLPKNVILSNVALTYIRTPQKIDYLLGIGSDLPDDIINKIIADTAQFTKGIIASDSYEKFTRENGLIE